MIKTYLKGSRAERELLRILSSRGYSCVRSASSGGFHSPVDIIAMKHGKILSFEIKSWSRKPKVDKKKIKSKVENKEKIKQEEIPSFNIDKYRNKLLSKIEVESSKLAKNEKVNIGKINIPSLHSTSLSLSLIHI